jgi:hypothetical protein
MAFGKPTDHEINRWAAKSPGPERSIADRSRTFVVGHSLRRSRCTTLEIRKGVWLSPLIYIARNMLSFEFLDCEPERLSQGRIHCICRNRRAAQTRGAVLEGTVHLSIGFIVFGDVPESV